MQIRYDAQPGSKLHVAAERVAAAEAEFAAANDRIDDFKQELAGLPPLHWKMSSAEASETLAQQAAISELIRLASHERARVDAALRARRRELEGMLAALDRIAERAGRRPDPRQEGHLPQQVALAKKEYLQALEAWCESEPDKPEQGENGAGVSLAELRQAG